VHIEEILKIYKEYSNNKELKPGYHRTHIALLLAKISSLIEWCSESKNEDTDRYSNLVYNSSILYEKLEEIVKDYQDNSQIYKLGGEEPNLFIEKLVDILIHLLIYVSGNNWDEKFVSKLDEAILRDSTDKFKKSRFKTRRLQ
jgi:hypothetical protein